MKTLFFLALILIFSFSSFAQAEDLKWNCEKLNLKFIEIPGTEGKQFSVDGCYQSETYFLISNDCKKNAKQCLSRGEKKKIEHPGGGIGSPGFIQCYRVGGRPRFLQVKVKDKWFDTYTCFFGSENSFMDFETISQNKK